jgi:hypothetical protein
MLNTTLTLGGLLILILVAAGCQTTRAGYKSAPYNLVRRDDAFEVRDYPVLILAETPMSTNGGDGSFNRLFKFITGRNATRQKIAMTTPVFMAADATNSTMSFVMPATMTAAQVPQPAESSVKIRETKPGRFAVFRFSGRRNQKNESAAVARLQSWMGSEKFSAASEPVFAYFDPPWTMPFLRRNEVMIRIGP